MEKADLADLLAAHGGRAQPVASLHVLRAESLGDAEQDFLAEHHEELATIDLVRWLALAAPAQRPAVIDALAALAERDPASFELEIVRAPHFQLEAGERAALTSRLAGRVPDSAIAALAGDGDAAPPRSAVPRAAGSAAPPSGEMFDPGDILGEMGLGPASSGGFAASAGVASGGLGEDLGDLLADADFLGSEGPGDGGGLFADAPAAHPQLDRLLADKASVNTVRAQRTWKAQARALAADPSEDWSRAVTRLPADMAEAVAVRAGASPRPDERATLLEWLLQNGARRAKLVELTAELIELTPKIEGVSQWLAQSFLARLLSDKAAWSKHGAALLAALVARRWFGELDQLFTAALTGAGALGPGLEAMTAASGYELCGPIFAAFATVLLDGTATALKEGDAKAARAFAATLAAFGVPSRQAKTVAALRRKKAAKGDVARLLGLAPARGPKALPALQDFIAAVHVLSDAL